MSHTNRDRELIIDNAIRDYENACRFHTAIKPTDHIANSINMMNNVYIMCSRWNTKGIDWLKKTIIGAEEKYKIKNETVEFNMPNTEDEK